MFNYAEEKLEDIPCNLCGVITPHTLASRAGNGTPARTVMCTLCGLIYVSPRMTKEGYDNYYKYFYRDDRTNSTGHAERGANLEENFEDSRKFAKALAKRIDPYISKHGLAIDVGSSTGGVLKGLQELFPSLKLLGIEPSLSESEFSRDHGVPTHTTLFEDSETRKIIAPRSASNILCVRSLNHLLDPRSFFEWSRESLQDGGYLILVVKNFRHQARRAGSVASGVQIDHVYMFTPETLKNLVEDCGFKTVFVESDEWTPRSVLQQQKADGLSITHIRLVAQKDVSKGNVTPWRKKMTYYKLRFQFSPLMIMFYHVLWYSRHSYRLQKLFHSK